MNELKQQLNMLNLSELIEIKKYITSIEDNLRERERLVKLLNAAK